MLATESTLKAKSHDAALQAKLLPTLKKLDGLFDLDELLDELEESEDSFFMNDGYSQISEQLEKIGVLNKVQIDRIKSFVQGQAEYWDQAKLKFNDGSFVEKI
jgi:hypothetical protein